MAYTMPNQSLTLARQSLLEPAGLTGNDLDHVMAKLLSARVDAADIYLQSSRYESWGLEDGIVKEGSHSIERGAGVRAVSGEKTGFAYSDEIALKTKPATQAKPSQSQAELFEG